MQYFLFCEAWHVTEYNKSDSESRACTLRYLDWTKIFTYFMDSSALENISTREKKRLVLLCLSRFL